MATIEEIQKEATKKFLTDNGYTMESKKKTLISVSCWELEKLINKVINDGLLEEVTWRGTYEIVAYEEWGNDESHEQDVTEEWVNKYPLSEYDLKQLKEGKISFMLGKIMTLMAQKGIIEYGEYLIDVSW